MTETRCDRAIMALRKPDASLARVPNTVRDSIAEVLEELRDLLREANEHIVPWETGVNAGVKRRIVQTVGTGTKETSDADNG